MATVISDEHRLIVDYLKRDAEAKRAAELVEGDASAQKKFAPAAEERPAKARLAAAEVAPARPAAKPVPEKKAAALRLVPALPEAAPPVAEETVGEIAEAGSPGVIGAVRGLVAHAAELPARLWSAVDRPPDDAPTPPLPLPRQWP